MAEDVADVHVDFELEDDLSVDEDSELFIAEIEEVDSEGSSWDSGDDDLERSLAARATEEYITQSAVMKLLKILRPHHPSLPTDARTLLTTSWSESLVVGGKAHGTYHYFGILKSMMTILEGCKNKLVIGACIELQVNVDWLPVFKSSSTQFWPILGFLKNLPQKKPFVIALFCGAQNPSLDYYLEDFEAEDLGLGRGFTFQGISMTLQLSSMVCDAPARGFLKHVKGHTGYSGGEKCI